MDLEDLFDAFNLIDRSEGLARTVANGGARELRVNRAGPFSGSDCERLLRHYAIPIWGRRVTGRDYVFSVPTQQAAWAEYLLLRAGVPITSDLIDPRNPARAAGHEGLPPAWADKPQAQPGPTDQAQPAAGARGQLAKARKARGRVDRLLDLGD